MGKQYYKQFPKIISQKVALAAGLRDREKPPQFGSILSEKAIGAISLRLSLVNQIEERLTAICWVAHHLLHFSYRDIAKCVPLSFGRVGDRVRAVDRWLDAIVPKESRHE